MKLILIGLSLTLLLIFGGVFFITKTNNRASLAGSQTTQVSVDKTSHDWGEIGINNGKVQAEFSLTNTGSAPLQLANISTSCMCTTAQAVIEGKASPYFGMHQKSAWTGQVEPGKSAKLIVEFDPAFHGPQGVGQITRQVVLETNDTNQKQLTFNLTANVKN
ncbi:DUF1573 domain-containing protein [Patescibacteria group bacterium]|nr:DUF1573 domain-containing protein [Patescibacteria group bacterium]